MNLIRVLMLGGFFALGSGVALAQSEPPPSPAPNQGPASTPENAPVAVPGNGNPGQQPGGQPPAPKVVARPAGMLNGHLPIIDVAPQVDWADPANTNGNPSPYGLPGVVSGNFNLSGTFTLPIYGGFSASYDHIMGSFLNSTFFPFYPTGSTTRATLGSVRRHVDQERIDYGFGKSGVTFEAGLTGNEFECCYNLQWHTGYAALTYATPGIKALGGLSFVFTEKGSTASHNPTQQQINAQNGLDIGDHREYGLSQIGTAVLPLGKNFSGTFTYFNGAYDFFNQEPFPYRFNLFNAQANYVIAAPVTFYAGWTNVRQFNQGSPFPNGNVIEFVNFYTGLKFHFDLNKLTAVPAPV